MTGFLWRFVFVLFLMSTVVVYLQRWHGWFHMKLLPSWRVLCTPYNHTLCHFMQSHQCKVHACLAATCHPHFWQNDRDLLCAAVYCSFSRPGPVYRLEFLYPVFTCMPGESYFRQFGFLCCVDGASFEHCWPTFVCWFFFSCSLRMWLTANMCLKEMINFCQRWCIFVPFLFVFCFAF